MLRTLPRALTRSPAAAGLVRSRRPRVLVADDNADMREYLGACFAALRRRCRRDGEEALAAIRRSRCDLVLSDVMMPALDGLALLERCAPTSRRAAAGDPALGARRRRGHGRRPPSAAPTTTSSSRSAPASWWRECHAQYRDQPQSADAAQGRAARTRTCAKDKFLAMLAHELRDPLAPIEAPLEVLRMGDPPGGPHVGARSDRAADAHLTRWWTICSTSRASRAAW